MAHSESAGDQIVRLKQLLAAAESKLVDEQYKQEDQLHQHEADMAAILEENVHLEAELAERKSRETAISKEMQFFLNNLVHIKVELDDSKVREAAMLNELQTRADTTARLKGELAASKTSEMVKSTELQNLHDTIRQHVQATKTVLDRTEVMEVGEKEEETAAAAAAAEEENQDVVVLLQQNSVTKHVAADNETEVCEMVLVDGSAESVESMLQRRMGGDVEALGGKKDAWNVVSSVGNKYYVKDVGGQLIVRVGGGWVQLERYLLSHGKQAGGRRRRNSSVSRHVVDGSRMLIKSISIDNSSSTKTDNDGSGSKVQSTIMPKHYRSPHLVRKCSRGTTVRNVQVPAWLPTSLAESG